MRALHLVKTSVGATWALRQMRELVKLGVDVHAMMPTDGPLVAAYRDAGVAVHPGQTSLPMRHPQQWRELFETFRAVVGSIQPDVIHSHFVGTTLTMRLALGRNHPVPRLFQVPGPLHLEHALFREGEIRTAGRADSWVGSCVWTCDRYHASGIPDDRIFLSYYGSDLDEIRSQAPGRLRGELDLRPATHIVGMVAFMYPPRWYLGQRRGLKGHEDAIDAIALLRQRGHDVVGVFVGGAWQGARSYEARVHAYARQKLGDHVDFMGTRSDVPALYADFDVVAHPSHSENVGGAAESQLLAVPTVATRVGGFPDLVIPGRTGWLVPPKDPARLADALADALSDPERAHAYARQGQALARELFDVRRTARSIRDVYETVAPYPLQVAGTGRR